MALDDLRDAMEVAIEFNLSAPAVIVFEERGAAFCRAGERETTWAGAESQPERWHPGRRNDRGVSAAVGADRPNGGRAADHCAHRGDCALNGGSLEGWRQSGRGRGQSWLAALDDLVRDTHRAAHGQVVGIDDNFSVGDGHGPHPGAIGIAAEDINCRCSMVPVLDVEGCHDGIIESVYRGQPVGDPVRRSGSWPRRMASSATEWRYDMTGGCWTTISATRWCYGRMITPTDAAHWAGGCGCRCRPAGVGD